MMAVCAAGYAQNSAPLSYMYDGITNNIENSYGTARSVALGNAMTAIGGDLGSVVINPAGGAVAKYNQVEFTPGISISSVTSAFSPSGESNYGFSSVENRTRMNFPGFGASFCMNTGHDYGLRSFTFGLIVTQTQDYNSSFSAGGRNDRTSLLAEFANGARGNYSKDLSSFDSGVSWDLVCGYNGRLFGGIDETEYAGNSEIYTLAGYCVPSALAQTSSVTTNGYRRDILMNFAFDINNRLYLGLSLGLPVMYKNIQEGYFESPDNYMDFYISLPDKGGQMVGTYYKGATYQFSQYTRMSGIYGKFGFIFLPMDNLRIGGAIKTPVAFSISEGYRYLASSTYENSSCNGYSYSPQDEWSFRMRSPWSFNVGVAYTFGAHGLFSVDYELTDYKSMMYSEVRNRTDYFYKVNKVINSFCGASHNVRAGLEWRFNPMFTARAGFTLLTSPEKFYTSMNGTVTASDSYYTDSLIPINSGTSHYYRDLRTSYSLGFGYSSPGSFFADFAARLNRTPAAVYTPFFDYDHVDINGDFHEVGTSSEELSPRILNNGRLWDIMLTIGFRF